MPPIGPPVAVKHIGFTAPEAVLRHAVQQATGAAMAAARPIPTAYLNDVYEATTADGRAVIVRVSINGLATFGREAWAIARCHEAGVPAPEILLLEEVDGGERALGICVESKLGGTSLNDVLKSTDDERLLRPLGNDLGAVLGRLHGVRPTGFGMLSPSGTGGHDSYAACIIPVEARQERLRAAAANVGLDRDVLERALEALTGSATVFQAVTPHLLHCDFGQRHIFAQDDKITGLIDFELCQSGDPALDFASWDYGISRRAQRWLPVAWLQEGYGDPSVFDDTYAERVCLHLLFFSLSNLLYYQSHNAHAVERAKSRLQDDLARLEGLR